MRCDMQVQVIQATERRDGPAEAKRAKLRVAAYCRVSTNSEEQESSYEAQCEHYRNYISSDPGWEFAGIYADEGISGTMAKRRPGFLRLIETCMAGGIDLVVTKSISRFARNTIDCLRYIRMLKEKGIGVLFEKENIHTLDEKGEVLITIMASIAQQESQSISENTRIGIQYRMQEGRGRLNTERFLGLRKGREAGSYEIVPEEATVVRRIYREYLEGYSPALIGRRLEADGFPTPSGKSVWYASTIASILTNEKYCGDVLLQKYYTSDFLTHKIVRNNGQYPMYYVENNHEPIVPREIYDRVQEERFRRSMLKHTPERIRFGSTSDLTGRLICARCGRTLKRYALGGGEIQWRCRDRIYEKRSGVPDKPSACGCRFVEDGEVKQILLNTINEIPPLLGQLKAELDRTLKTAGLPRRRNPWEPEAAEAVEATEATALDRACRLRAAELYHRAMQIRMMLEFTEQLAPKAAERHTAEGGRPAACYHAEDFFSRTREPLPDRLFDASGQMTVYDSRVVSRLIEHVKVEDEGYQILFRTGQLRRVVSSQGCMWPKSQ